MTSTQARPALRGAEFIVLAAFMMSVFALSVDVMIPALALIGQDLGTSSDNQTQYIVHRQAPTGIKSMGGGGYVFDASELAQAKSESWRRELIELDSVALPTCGSPSQPSSKTVR